MVEPSFHPLLSILGSIMFAIAAIPTAWRTLRHGSSIGTLLSLVWPMLLGCTFVFAFWSVSEGWDPVRSAIYGVQLMSWGTILFYHYFPRTWAQAQAMNRAQRVQAADIKSDPNK